MPTRARVSDVDVDVDVDVDGFASPSRRCCATVGAAEGWMGERRGIYVLYATMQLCMSESRVKKGK